jgi:YHS domain-containing protein
MESLIYFLLWAALLVGIMRFGCGAHVMGHGRRHSNSAGAGTGSSGQLRWTPPEKDKDPVCGMTVATATSKSSVYDGLVYYFCSTTCRDKFEASPSTYINAPGAPSQPVEHQHDSHH